MSRWGGGRGLPIQAEAVHVHAQQSQQQSIDGVSFSCGLDEDEDVANAATLFSPWCKQAPGLLLYSTVAYLSWKDGLVAGGTLGSKNPVEEATKPYSAFAPLTWLQVMNRLQSGRH